MRISAFLVGNGGRDGELGRADYGGKGEGGI